MEKQWWAEAERRESLEERKSQKKEDAGAQKGTVAKSRFTLFSMICGSGGSKSRLAKAAGAEPCGHARWRIARRCAAKHISKSKCTKHTRFGPLLEVEMFKKRTPLWREAHLEVKMYKAHSDITTLFVGCKQGGRSKSVSNNFDPCVFFPDGEGYLYLRPLLRQKPCPGRFTFREGGVKVRKR